MFVQTVTLNSMLSFTTTETTVTYQRFVFADKKNMRRRHRILFCITQPILHRKARWKPMSCIYAIYSQSVGTTQRFTLFVYIRCHRLR